jgi:hypothetical protein
MDRRVGPPTDVRCEFLALSVQHTGTHFLGATLRYLTGLSSLGWPPASVGAEPVGFSMRHLYGHHELGALPWPDPLQQTWMARWWGTDLPVVVSLRSASASFETLRKRPQSNYNRYDHEAALRELELLLELDRVVGLQIDGDAADRKEGLMSVLHHLRDRGAAFEWPPEARIDYWAEAWPLLNSTAR